MLYISIFRKIETFATEFDVSLSREQLHPQ